MIALADDRPFGGAGQRVEVDETLIKYMRDWRTTLPVRATVFGISDGTRVWTCRVRSRKKCELIPIIKRRIIAGSIIDTDGYRTYAKLAAIGYEHRVTNHSAGFWVGRDGANTLHIDSYWSYLKRTFARTYVCVDTGNMDGYLKEIEVRFNYRDDPTALFWDVISCHPPFVGSRLPHA
jgi:transposase-like protein